MLTATLHLAESGLLMIAAMMLALWVIHLLIHNAAVVDAGWAAALATLAIFYAAKGPGYSARKWAIALMAGFWGLRLAFYLLFSRVINKPEEGRYLQLRREWKTHLPLRFLFFFEFQAVLTVLLSLPFLLASLNTAAPLGKAEKIGAGIWLVSICVEAIADY
jgi:steroid 5-alpha reductase family enzyme